MTFEYEQFFFNNIVCQSQLDKPLTTLGMISYISLPVSRALYRGGKTTYVSPLSTIHSNPSMNLGFEQEIRMQVVTAAR